MSITESMAVSRYDDVSVEVVAVLVEGARPKDRMRRLLPALSGSSMVPVVDQQGRLSGVIRDLDLLAAMAIEGDQTLADWLAQNSDEALQKTETLPVNANISDVRAFFAEHDQFLAPLIDERGRYSGLCASRSMLVRLLQGTLRPDRVGGLATPLGVYMTSGHHTAGAGMRGLLVLGVVFGVFVHVLDFVQMVFLAAAVSLYPPMLGWGDAPIFTLQVTFLMLTVLAAIRYTPLSGLHAAEHMTINAIERDLPIEPDVVSRQPKEHLRCGTNLMVFIAGLQVGVISLQMIGNQLSLPGVILYVAAWDMLVLRYWKPVGLWLQRHFTTRYPTAEQLESGLKAGHELLEKFRSDPHPPPSFWQKLITSGFLQMATVFILTSWGISVGLAWLGSLR